MASEFEAPGRAGTAALLPVPFILALSGMVALPQVRREWHVLAAFLGAAALLAVWWAVLYPRRRTFKVEVVLRKQHYLQACAQGAVFLYWGLYWPQVYASFHLL